jgi:hypothetical protein
MRTIRTIRCAALPDNRQTSVPIGQHFNRQSASIVEEPYFSGCPAAIMPLLFVREFNRGMTRVDGNAGAQKQKEKGRE